MPSLQLKVEPGDLITASLMNDVLRQLEQLEVRIAVLEKGSVGTAGVKITELTGSKRIGSLLEIIGKNFEVPVALNTIQIDNIPITNLNSGTSTKIVFNIPPNISGAPKEVTLTVSNANGSDSHKFIVLPAEQIPEGQLVITENLAGIGQINIGQTYTYQFILNSETIPGETYRLEAKYDSVVGASDLAWRENTTLVLPNGQQQFIELPSFTPVTIGVKVKIPAGAQRARLYLVAQSVHNDAKLSRTSSAVAIKVGSEQEASDPRVDVKVQPFGLLAKARLVKVDGVDTIEVPFQSSANLSFKASFKVAGTYTFETVMDPAAGSDWTIANLNPSGPTQRQKDETQIITMVATLKTAENTAHTEARELMVKVNRTDNDTDGKLTSYVKIPIRGFQP
jgi:hypothetical protein